jgi:signal transduction histidine kinase
MANGEQLVRVLCNLIDNAISAMKGEGVLTVTSGVREDGRELTIEVTDTGPGIPEAYRAKLFQPFFTRKTGGTGLGLAIVRRMVEDHGGRVEAGDAPGGGARFTIYLPAAQPTDSSPQPSPQRGEGAKGESPQFPLPLRGED